MQLAQVGQSVALNCCQNHQEPLGVQFSALIVRYNYKRPTGSATDRIRDIKDKRFGVVVGIAMNYGDTPGLHPISETR